MLRGSKWISYKQNTQAKRPKSVEAYAEEEVLYSRFGVPNLESEIAFYA